MKLAEGAFGFILLVVFIGWIFVAESPHTRLQRACAPVNWVGRASLSTVALIHPEWEVGTRRFFQKTDYDCQYVLWSQFYAPTWHKLQKKRLAVTSRPGATGA